jgi:glycosyltransferase involved in cell wall biosynthesis
MLLLPSREEPFGRTLIEAMALGVPVLATNVGGPAEIITDGREGYLLPPLEPHAWAAAIRSIAQTPGLGAEMGKAGRSRVQGAFTVEHQTAGILAAYRHALAEPAGRVRT